MTASYYVLSGTLASPGFVTQGFLTPRCNWSSRHSVTSTVTTTVWVVYGVHNNTAYGRSNTLTAITSSLTNLLVLMLHISNSTDVSHSIQVNQANFTARQSNLSVVTI